MEHVGDGEGPAKKESYSWELLWETWAQTLPCFPDHSSKLQKMVARGRRWFK